MTVKANSISEYLQQVPEERVEVLNQLIKIANKKLKGFEQTIIYGMIGYVVPFKTFPAGYHCDPSLPLSFFAIASQKNFIALYHMGLYSDSKLMDWFVNQYPLHCKGKLDIGKSCIRFKKMDDIPYKLIEELLGKMSVKEWVDLYSNILDTRKK